jgi:hypothetical protein
VSVVARLEWYICKSILGGGKCKETDRSSTHLIAAVRYTLTYFTWRLLSYGMWHRVVLKTATGILKGPTASIFLNMESQPTRQRCEKIAYRIYLFIYLWIWLTILVHTVLILVRRLFLDTAAASEVTWSGMCWGVSCVFWIGAVGEQRSCSKLDSRF